MLIDIVMPKMGESITEGTILEWKKKIGDFVDLDEILLEIGTDKVDSEIPSPTAGYVVEIIGKPNDIFDVGSVIARVETEKNESTIKDEALEEASKNIKSENETKIEISEKIIPNLNEEKDEKKDEKKFFTPAVNKIAKKNNLSNTDLLSITGSGKDNRVTKLDVLKYIKSKNKRSIVKDSEPEIVKKIQEIDESSDKVEMDHIRKKIAVHMRKSLDTSAHVYVTTEVDMSKIVDYVSMNEERFMEQEEFRLTYTPFLFYATVQALSSFPEMNSSLEDDKIIYHKNINIGMAVAVDNGLMVPVLNKCEELNFLGLSRKINTLTIKTRDRSLSPDDLQGSTFSISNFGVFNVTMGTPIINQPNVGILGIGTIKKRPVVIETFDGDTIGIKSIMYATLGFDHRLIDGAGGSRFIESVRSNIENMNLESLF